VLASNSGEAIEWIQKRGDIALDKVGQLGGHSAARTYRPSTGLAGQELVYALQRVVKKFPKERMTIMTRTRATKLIMAEDGGVAGVEWENVKAKTKGSFAVKNVLIATGGFASGGSMLEKYRKDLMGYPTTNGLWATGEGHAMAESVGAITVGMDDVQVHPTAFVDPLKPEAPKKTLAAEILRGVGAILLDRNGLRFANELGKRDYVTGRMIASESVESKQTNAFYLLLNGKGSAVADKHVPMYLKKGMLQKYDTLAEVAAWMKVPEATLLDTFSKYNADAEKGEDQFGKKFFHNTPYTKDAGPWHAGIVTPALHYTMGGIKINGDGEVLRADGSKVKGLYAAGEAVGGVHGQNRLGGNALTECAVFGKLVGEKMQLMNDQAAPEPAAAAALTVPAEAPQPKTARIRKVSKAELAHHNTDTDCWVSLYGKVYDFTDFLEEHPAGAEALLEYGGKDGSDIFTKVHNMAMLDDFEPLGEMEG